MPSAERAVELAHALLHIGGLSGAATLIAEGHLATALLLALIASACVLILTGAVALAEITKVMVRQFVRRHEQRSLPGSRDKGGLSS